MKRLNHLVLGSITVLASIALAGLFIFPASGEGEQHYNCELNDEGDEYNCTLVEDQTAIYTHTCVLDGNRTRCTGEGGENKLNFCWGITSLTCEKGYTKNETKSDGGYYFIEDFGGEFQCHSTHEASLGVNDLRGVSDFGEYDYACYSERTPSEQYNLCDKKADGSMFCLTKYVPEVDGGVAILSENSAAESGYFYCEVMPIASSSANWVLDSTCYIPEPDSEFEVDCSYNNGDFICPIEHTCYEGPGGMLCYMGYDEGGYYCASDNLFNPAVDNVNDKNNSCLPINEGTEYNNCEYINGIYGMGYFCPIQQSCELDTDGYHCDSETGGEYTCYPNISTNFIEPTMAEPETEPETPTFSCKKAGEEPITNCQVKEREDSELHSTSELVVPDFYLFCPVEIKYDCDSEDGLAVVCNPSTTGNFSCELPTPQIPQDVNTVNHIQDGDVVCSYGTGRYDNCYPDNLYNVGGIYSESPMPYVCPIKYECEPGPGGTYCEFANSNDENYYYCSAYTLDLAFGIDSDIYCEEQKENGETYGDCYYQGYGEIFCPAKYECIPEEGGHQCNINEGGEYKCGLTSGDGAAKNVAEEGDIECFGEGNTYNNCYPNGGGYFCPEEESTTVTLDLYMGGCISNSAPTAAAAASEYYCDGNGYLRSVTVNINAGVNPKYLTNEVKEKLPNLEEGMEWVWYLENDHNGNKLAESTTFAQNSSLYVFQDERKIGTISFNSDGGTDVPSVTGYYDTTITLPSPTKTGYTFAGWYDGNNKVSMSYTIVGDRTLIAHWTDSKPSGGYSGGGGSSSKPSSKGSGPSTSEVKSTENEPTTPAKEVKAEPKPVVPGKGANYTGKVNPNQELFDAYEWAYANGLTKYSNMSDARMDDLLNRQEMAKISTIFATKFQGETPNEKKRDDCSQYPDLWKTTKDMQEFIIQSCELGYMGYRANGIDYLERFRPYTPVSVAEVSIILSRIMWQNKYAISENLWYQGHLHAVYENNLLDNISKPFDYIARKDAYIMLYRISKTL